MKITITALLQVIAYACLLFASAFTDMNEAMWRILVFVALPIVGVFSVWFFGKDGIIGNCLALVFALIVYAMYSHDKDALWLIGLFMIPMLHILEVVAWALTLIMKKTIENRP